ncbi:hypothetical protein [Lentzea flava]|uniref:Ricin-type beta-trefoil lectin domain-containing protein n=1 Tax=Lentzea flava TaxID=103732 RepID=A0ABQ2VHA9_9PSEU|nr:hypothetical protein [Lentzea flava]MCP2205159.1 hypothetical protein [Lentzea flava]GGU84035.1 hypothetical protein GCM10010178_87940 [Lentzea flava]
MTSPAQRWHQEHTQHHPVGKKPKITKLGIVVTTVFLLGLGVVGYFSFGNDPGVGDCAEAKSQSRERLDFVKSDCSAPQAMYRLAESSTSSSPTCPDGDYVKDTGKSTRKSQRKRRDCYTLNVREGDCLTLTSVGEFTLHQRAACGPSTSKVTKVVDGKSDEKLCNSDDDSHVYSKPASTICISKV